MAHSLRGGGFDASEDGTGRGTPLIPVSFAIQAGAARENPDSGPDGVGVQEGHAYTLEARSEVQAIAQGVALRGRDGGATAELTGDVMTSLRTGGGGGDKPHVLLHIGFSCKDSGADAADGIAPTLRAMNFTDSHANAGGQLAVAFAENTRNELRLVDGDGGIAPSLQTQGGKAWRGYPAIAFNARQDPDVYDGHSGPLDTDGSTQGIFSRWRVRRLMPVECERLQGFPDGYTDVPYRRRNWTADGPRYKALGNSMACNVMRWIGWRIEMVEKMKS